MTLKSLSLAVAACLLVGGAWLALRGADTLAETRGNGVRQTIIDTANLPLREKLPALRAAREQQERALQDDVGDSYGWVRLALIRLKTQNNRDGALKALRTAQLAAPYEPKLMVERAYAFYSLRDLHTPTDDAMMKREWRYAFFGSFVGDKEKFVALMKAHPDLVPEVDRAMRGDAKEYWWKAERQKMGF